MPCLACSPCCFHTVNFVLVTALDETAVAVVVVVDVVDVVVGGGVLPSVDEVGIVKADAAGAVAVAAVAEADAVV